MRQEPENEDQGTERRSRTCGRGAGSDLAPAPAQRQVAVRTDATASAASVSSPTASTVSEGHGEGRGPLFSLPSPFGNSAPTSSYDRYTAVYDISARIVYLPDGTKLEAHSGLGDALDSRDLRQFCELGAGASGNELGPF